MTPEQKDDLLKVVRKVLPDAEYAPEESWDNTSSFIFQDTCGCYSEYTQEPCELAVFLKATFTDSGAYSKKVQIEQVVTKWAHKNLEWHGCDACGENSLIVNISLWRTKE